jgi:ribosomal-protein-alanine N-acetyltransferase
MREDDLDAVGSLELINFATPWTRSSFYEELHNPRSILKVAESNKNVIGYICVSHIHDEGHILKLAVDVLYRRRGVASTLVKDSLMRLRELGCMNVYLEVRTSNRAAVEMYNKLKFEHIGRRREYYHGPREDAIQMAYDLSRL